MLIMGVDPGLGASPTGVALVRFAGLTPTLADRWTLKSERGDWQTRCDEVLFRLSRLILPRRAELTALCYELSWVGVNDWQLFGFLFVLLLASEERRAA